jgi:hypothetical protein
MILEEEEVAFRRTDNEAKLREVVDSIDFDFKFILEERIEGSEFTWILLVH